MKAFLNLSGSANMLAGVLLLAYWYLYAILMPYKDLTNTLSILVLDRHWTFVNIFGVAGSLIGLIGIVGLYVKAADVISNLGLIGFVLAFIGTTIFTAFLLWDTVLWPILANYDATLLDFSGPIYTSKTFFPLFIITGLIYGAGYMILGIALARSGIFPYWGSLLITIGAPLFSLGAMFGKLQVYPRTLGITLFSIGMIWLGKSMIK